MFAPPSLQREYVLCSPMDPALDLPEVPVIGEDAKMEDIALRDEMVKVRDHKLKVARETGKWDALIKPGQKPTMFRFRNIHGGCLNWLHGESTRRNLIPDECFELAFRLAVVSVDNFPGLEIRYEMIDGFKIATRDSLDRLYDIGRDTNEPQLGRQIVLELGAHVFSRAVNGVSPLS